jgi:hypothetical protein
MVARRPGRERPETTNGGATNKCIATEIGRATTNGRREGHDDATRSGKPSTTRAIHTLKISRRDEMTSRDFRAIAATIAELDVPASAAEGTVHAYRMYVAQAFARTLSSTNPRFDRERFIAAATGNARTPGDKPRASDYR